MAQCAWPTNCAHIICRLNLSRKKSVSFASQNTSVPEPCGRASLAAHLQIWPSGCDTCGSWRREGLLPTLFVGSSVVMKIRVKLSRCTKEAGRRSAQPETTQGFVSASSLSRRKSAEAKDTGVFCRDEQRA